MVFGPATLTANHKQAEMPLSPRLQELRGSPQRGGGAGAPPGRAAGGRLALPAHHRRVVLLQSRRPDRPAEEPPVAHGVLLPLKALVQQLVVQQKQLVPEGADLI